MAEAGRSRMWTILLVASLGLNLVVGGAMLARHFKQDVPERLVGAGYTQLVPRSFLREMPREKRRAILDILKNHRKDFRADRAKSEEIAKRFGEALAAEPYNAEAATAVVHEFSEASRNLAARGGAVAMEIIGTLSHEQRLMLSNAISDRAKNAKPAN